jgi:hypothetical protein
MAAGQSVPDTKHVPVVLPALSAQQSPPSGQLVGLALGWQVKGTLASEETAHASPFGIHVPDVADVRQHE